MTVGRILRAERERYQGEGLKSSAPTFEVVAKKVFPGIPHPAVKLKRIEAGVEMPTRECARRLLRAYGSKKEKRAEALAIYSVHEQLTELVEESGLTRRAIAKRTGLSYHHLTRVLNGRRLISSQEQLVRLTRVLEVEDDVALLLLSTARIEANDPLWHRELLRKKTADRERDIGLFRKLRQGLRRGVGKRVWKSTASNLSGEELGVMATGPLEIGSLAAHVVRHHERRPPALAHRPQVKISLGKHFVGDKNHLAVFFGAVCDVLEDGVGVQVLLPYPDSAERLFRTIENVISFVGFKGRFDLRYVSKHHSKPLRLIMSRAGKVMHILPPEYDHKDDVATVVDGREGLYQEHFDRRFQAGRSLVRLIQSDAAKPSSLQRALRQAESEPGDRLFMRRRLTTTMIPVSHWQWEIEQIIAPTRHTLGNEEWDPWRFERCALSRPTSVTLREQFLEELRDEKVKRYRRHVANLNANLTREMYPRASFEQFLNDPNLPGLVRDTIVDQFLDWIADCEQYRLALVDDPEVFEGALGGLHGGQSVFLSVWRDTASADYLQIHHEFAASAFKAYYASLWDSLPEKSTNQHDLSEYLRSLKSASAGSWKKPAGGRR